MKNVWYSLIFLFAFLFAGCADAGKDQLVTSSTTVTLDGSLSTTEVGGEIKKYKWKQISGENVNLKNKNEVKSSFVSPNVLEDTTLVFELTTIEKGGYKSPYKTTDIVKVLVQPQTSNNNPPIATIQTSATQIKLNQTINFDASLSTDSDGTIVTYEWKNSDGDIISSDEIFDHIFTSIGNHIITLKITDDTGLSSSVSVDIVVNDLINPIANISVNADTINIGDNITFDASVSSDADGEVVLYTWKDADANILSSEKTYTHTFNTQGQYPITLTVEDNDGLTNTKEIIITVQALLTSIELSPSYITIKLSQTSNINAKGFYDDNTSIDMTQNANWEISDSSIISISDDGTITALKEGIASVQLTIGGIISNSIRVNVNNITINDPSYNDIFKDDMEKESTLDILNETTHTQEIQTQTTQIITDTSTYAQDNNIQVDPLPNISEEKATVEEKLNKLLQDLNNLGN